MNIWNNELVVIVFKIRLLIRPTLFKHILKALDHGPVLIKECFLNLTIIEESLNGP